MSDFLQNLVSAGVGQRHLIFQPFNPSRQATIVPVVKPRLGNAQLPQRPGDPQRAFLDRPDLLFHSKLPACWSFDVLYQFVGFGFRVMFWLYDRSFQCYDELKTSP